MPSAPGVDIFVAMEIKESMDHSACQLALGYMAIILSYQWTMLALSGGRGIAMFEPVFSFLE